MQYNCLLEIVGSDLKEFQKFSLAVTDKERFSYHLITHTETREDTNFAIRHESSSRFLFIKKSDF